MGRFVDEFKKFALKGNAIDMAVGVVIGGGFGKIVTSLVNDIIMPPLGLVLGKVDFSELSFKISAPLEGMKPVTIRYGLFINTILDFMIVAIAIFLVVLTLNKLHTKQPTSPLPTTKECPQCLSVIPIKAAKCAFCTSVIALGK